MVCSKQRRCEVLDKECTGRLTWQRKAAVAELGQPHQKEEGALRKMRNLTSSWTKEHLPGRILVINAL